MLRPEMPTSGALAAWPGFNCISPVAEAAYKSVYCFAMLHLPRVQCKVWSTPRPQMAFAHGPRSASRSAVKALTCCLLAGGVGVCLALGACQSTQAAASSAERSEVLATTPVENPADAQAATAQPATVNPATAQPGPPIESFDAFGFTPAAPISNDKAATATAALPTTSKVPAASAAPTAPVAPSPARTRPGRPAVRPEPIPPLR